MELIEKNYDAPRWSAEICDCSMPMTFDTYSVCSYNCLYCFAYYQRSHCVSNFLEKIPHAVNVDRVKKLFNDSLEGRFDRISAGNLAFGKYINNRITMQWGGMNDPFDEYEKEYGIGLELLKYFDEIDYPLSLSTKGTFFINDKRYMKLIKKHPHNWHFKISIITLDTLKSKAIEEQCPSPQERLKVIQALTDINIPVTLRLRPYIIGLSEDYPKLIMEAGKRGADSVTTEFFCLEMRANELLKSRYDKMSKYLGYDLWEFYRKNSTGSGYLRLNYNIKAPIIHKMQKITHKLGMRYYVSDSHHKEKSDSCCCCGTPLSFRVSHGHFAEALQIAKQNGQVSWDEIKDDIHLLFGEKKFYGHGFKSENKMRSQRLKQTIEEYLQEIWNTPKNPKSPYKYFRGILNPSHIDGNGNIVYTFDYDKSGIQRVV